MNPVNDTRMAWFSMEKYKNHPDFVKFKNFLPEFDFENYQHPEIRKRNINLLMKKSSIYYEIITNKGGWILPQKMYFSDMNYCTKAEEQIKLLDSFIANQTMARSLYTRFKYLSDDLLPKHIRKILNKKDIVRIASFGSGTGVDVMEALMYFDSNVTADFFDTDPKAIEIGKVIAKKMGLDSRVNFYNQNIMKIETDEQYDIGLMIGIICPLPDAIAIKVMGRVRKNITQGGILIVSSSGKLMGEEDPLNRFLAEYTTKWFLQYRTNERMKSCGENSGYRVLKVDNEPMDYNKMLICQNLFF